MNICFHVSGGLDISNLFASFFFIMSHLQYMTALNFVWSAAISGG